MSIASKPRSSSARIAVERPAPAGPLMMTICCPASGLPASVTSLPRAQHASVLASLWKGAAVLHDKWSTRRSRFGTSSTANQFKVDSQVRDCRTLWHSCRGRALEVDRERPAAPRAPPAGAGCRRRAPRSARRSSPAPARAARRRRAAASPGRRRPAPPRARSAPAPSADLPAARGAEEQHPAAAERDRRGREAISDSSNSAIARRLLSLRRDANATEHRTQQDRDIRRPEFRRIRISPLTYSANERRRLACYTGRIGSRAAPRQASRWQGNSLIGWRDAGQGV